MLFRCAPFCRKNREVYPFLAKPLIIINDTLARSLEPVVTECKEHTIHTQAQVVASNPVFII